MPAAEKMTREQMEEARAKLDALAKELGVAVGACGCCDSPWLMPAAGREGPFLNGVSIGPTRSTMIQTRNKRA